MSTRPRGRRTLPGPRGGTRLRPLPTLTLRPDPGSAALWTAWSAILVAAGVWFVRSSGASPIPWLTLGVFVLVAAYFLLQLAWPGAVEVRLTQDELQARAFWFRTTIPWERIHLARVRRVFGDPVLELHVRERAPAGDPWQTRAMAVLLPVGVDLAPVHAFLAARLGRGSLAHPGRLEPLPAPSRDD